MNSLNRIQKVEVLQWRVESKEIEKAWIKYRLWIMWPFMKCWNIALELETFLSLYFILRLLIIKLKFRTFHLWNVTSSRFSKHFMDFSMSMFFKNLKRKIMNIVGLHEKYRYVSNLLLHYLMLRENGAHRYFAKFNAKWIAISCSRNIKEKNTVGKKIKQNWVNANACCATFVMHS